MPDPCWMFSLHDLIDSPNDPARQALRLSPLTSFTLKLREGSDLSKAIGPFYSRSVF